MAQYEHEFSSVWNPYPVGESDLSTYERLSSLVNQESPGGHPRLNGGLGQHALPAHDLETEFATVYDYRGTTNGVFPHSSTLPVASILYSSGAADGSTVHDQHCETAMARYEPSAASFITAHVPPGVNSNISNGSTPWLAPPSHECWNPQGYAPPMTNYAQYQMPAGLSMTNVDLDVPVTASYRLEDSVQEQSSSQRHEASLDGMMVPRETISQTSGYQGISSAHTVTYQQQQWPLVALEETDGSAWLLEQPAILTPTVQEDLNNRYKNEDIQTTQPVGPNSRISRGPRSIHHHDRTVLRVPIPRECKEAVPEWEMVRFTANQTQGIRVSDVLNGTVTIDHAGRRDFERWPYKTIHCCVSWPGYGWGDYGDGNKFPVQNAAKIFIRRDELAKRVCLKIQNFLFECSSKKPQSGHRGWSLSERSPNPIQLSDIWLISIHRTKCGGRWIPILELRR